MRRPIMTLAALGAALALSACGGDGDADATSSASSTSSEAAAGSTSSTSTSSTSGSESTSDATGSGSASASATNDGGGDSEAEDESGSTPEEAVKDFATAVAEQDYGAICEAFSSDTVEAMMQGSTGTGSCEEQLEESGDELGAADAAEVDKLEVTKVSVSSDEQLATVTTSYEGQTNQLSLVMEDGRWKLAAA